MIEFLFQTFWGIAALVFIWAIGRFVHFRMVLMALNAYRNWKALESVHPHNAQDPIAESFQSVISIITPDGSNTGSFSNFPNSRERFFIQLGEGFIHITPSRNLVSVITGQTHLEKLSFPLNGLRQIQINLFQVESGEWLFIPKSPLLLSLARRVK